MSSGQRGRRGGEGDRVVVDTDCDAGRVYRRIPVRHVVVCSPPRTETMTAERNVLWPPRVRFCWLCSRKLYGRHYAEKAVDGETRIMHKECAREATDMRLEITRDRREKGTADD